MELGLDTGPDGTRNTPSPWRRCMDNPGQVSLALGTGGRRGRSRFGFVCKRKTLCIHPLWAAFKTFGCTPSEDHALSRLLKGVATVCPVSLQAHTRSSHTLGTSLEASHRRLAPFCLLCGASFSSSRMLGRTMDTLIGNSADHRSNPLDILFPPFQPPGKALMRFKPLTRRCLASTPGYAPFMHRSLCHAARRVDIIPSHGPLRDFALPLVSQADVAADAHGAI